MKHLFKAMINPTMSTHTEDTKEMTVAKLLREIDFWKSQERNGHSFEEMSKALEALKESVQAALTLYASQVREEAVAREKQLKEIHTMELDAISCKSIEDFVIWRDYRKQRPKQAELTTLTPKT